MSVVAIGSSREGLDERRAQLREDIARGEADAEDCLRELAELDAWSRAADEETRAAELDRLARVHEAMGRLHDCATAEELIEAAPREVCAATGLNRAMISRVRGSLWDPSVLYAEPGVDPGIDEFRAFIEDAQIPLDHMLMETELVRRRVPALVNDPEADPRTFKPIVEVSRSTSYVTAPIMPTRRVIGFFHADRFGEDRPCDENDRDALWAFAEHFGLLFERLVLLERLEHQRARLRAALSKAAEDIDEAVRAELALVRRGPMAVPPAAAASARRGTSRVAALLTPRECEVLDLLAGGLTNAGVAQQLVLSEGTVKSHLKRILRKLHVTNRSEAVAKYLHLRNLDEERGS